MSFIDLSRHPAIHVRLRPGFRVVPSPDGGSLLIESFGMFQPIGRTNPHFAAALPLLHDGGPLAALRDRVLDAGGSYAAASFLLWLQRLSHAGLVDYPIHGSSGRLAVVLPQRRDVVPLPAATAPGSARPLSRFAFLRRQGDDWLLEHPLAGARIAFPDLAIAAAVVQPDAARSTSDDLRIVFDVLAALGFLDDDGRGAAVRGDEGARVEALRQWEFHDLAFHFHSRRGWHFDAAGAVFPYVGDIAPQPALRPAWEGACIPLARAQPDSASAPLAGVMERRRSYRRYADGSAPSLAELGVFLDRVARVRETSTLPVTGISGRRTEMEISRRVYPNGGASYELEIYPVVDRCDGLEPGLFHYDAGRHVLVRISGRTAETERMMRDAAMATAGIATPQILFAITARFGRVMWKYKSIGYAVILRNAGVLYHTMYLTATDMGLSPCGIGSGDSALFAAATKLDPTIEGTVGEFILGGRPGE